MSGGDRVRLAPCACWLARAFYCFPCFKPPPTPLMTVGRGGETLAPVRGSSGSSTLPLQSGEAEQSPLSLPMPKYLWR